MYKYMCKKMHIYSYSCVTTVPVSPQYQSGGHRPTVGGGHLHGCFLYP